MEPDNEDDHCDNESDLCDKEVYMMLGITESFKNKIKAKVSRKEVSILEETKFPSFNNTQSTPAASIA